MSCQATFEEIRIETSVQFNKEKENAQNISVVDKTVMQPQTLQPNTSKSTVPIKSSAPVAVSAGHQNTSQTTVASKSLSTVSRGSDTVQTSLSTMQRSSEEIASNSTCVTSRPSDIVLSVSSVTTSTTTPPVIYRTLKSPVISGAPMLPQRVALKSSLPSLPVQQSFTGVKPSLGSVMSVASPTEFRYDRVTFVSPCKIFLICFMDQCLTRLKQSFFLFLPRKLNMGSKQDVSKMKTLRSLTPLLKTLKTPKTRKLRNEKSTPKPSIWPTLGLTRP